MRPGAIALALTLSCGGAGPEGPLPESQPPPGAPEPQINVQPATTVALDSTVTVDGSASKDSQGYALEYLWQLTVPLGSRATLSSLFGAKASFVPDVSGDYTVVLAVTNGIQTSRQVGLGVSAGAPRIPLSLSSKRYAERGVSVTLDALGLYSDGRPFQFAWKMESAPSGSSVSLAGTTTQAATFTPDLEGTYLVSVEVTAPGARNRATCTVLAAARLPTVPFRPVQARYSRSLDAVIAISAAPNQLHLFEPTAQRDVTIALPSTPRSLNVSREGLHAVVGYDAALSYVDLGTGQILQTWPLGTSAGDLALGDSVTSGGRTTRFAYVFPGGTQVETVHRLDLVSGAETSFGTVFGGTRAALAPTSPTFLFGVTSTLSPGRLYKFGLDAAGAPSSAETFIPTSNNIVVRDNVWASDDGLYVLTGGGTRFRTADASYAGYVSFYTNPYPLPVASADWSQVARRWIVQRTPDFVSDDFATDSSYWTVDDSLGNPVRTDYPRHGIAGSSFLIHGRWIFFDGSAHPIVVAELSQSLSSPASWFILRL